MSTAAYFHECFAYDQGTGALKWKDRPRSHFLTDRGWRCFNNRNSGTDAGSKTRNPDGSAKAMIVCAFYRKYRVHTVAWCMANGKMPTSEVLDHINGDPFDNRISNLREATQHQNTLNVRRKKNNRSGVTGVSYNARAKKWVSQIQFKGKNTYLGLFSDLTAAIERRKQAEVEMFGEYRRA